VSNAIILDGQIGSEPEVGAATDATENVVTAG